MPRHHPWPLGRTLLLGAVAVVTGWTLASGAGLGTSPTAAETVVVRPGDTVWNIAAAHAGGGDVRAEVARILAVNGLTSSVIQPGETLILPSG